MKNVYNFVVLWCHSPNLGWFVESTLTLEEAVMLQCIKTRELEKKKAGGYAIVADLPSMVANMPALVNSTLDIDKFIESE